MRREAFPILWIKTTEEDFQAEGKKYKDQEKIKDAKEEIHA